MVKKELIERKIIELFGNQSELVKSLISPAIGIKLKDKVDQPNQIQSKIGGWPYTSAHFIWPDKGGRPLTFLCQINLSELWKFHSILPSKGMLYFFVANKECKDFACLENVIKVIYDENLPNVKPYSVGVVPLDEYGIEFYEHFTLPSYQEQTRLNSSSLAEMSDSLDELQQSISELTYNDKDFTNHHMLGDPNAVQGSVRIYWGAKLLDPQDTFYKKISDCLDQVSDIGSDFVLLLQIDLLDGHVALSNYGDCCLYFGIPKEDLMIKNFNRVKLVIQNT